MLYYVTSDEDKCDWNEREREKENLQEMFREKNREKREKKIKIKREREKEGWVRNGGDEDIGWKVCKSNTADIVPRTSLQIKIPPPPISVSVLFRILRRKINEQELMLNFVVGKTERLGGRGRFWETQYHSGLEVSLVFSGIRRQC